MGTVRCIIGGRQAVAQGAAAAAKDGKARARRSGVNERARRGLLRVHALRTGGALQPAAAIEASEGSPQTLSFVTLDDLLAEAAAKEGFPVLTPGVR